jgi:hypothetical protein
LFWDFYFKLQSPVRLGSPLEYDNWRGTEQARKYISELLDKNGIR